MALPNQGTISIAVPNKGRLSEGAIELLRQGGLRIDGNGSNGRQLITSALGGRVRILAVRAQDIPELVVDGMADLGITGLDLVLESGLDPKLVRDLRFGHCRLVAAVPEKRGVRSVEELPADARIATAFPNLTRRYFEERGRAVRIVPVSGATEVMPHIGVADAIADLTATGSTLAMNDLVEIGSILESTAYLIANRASLEDPEKAAWIERVDFALASVVCARGKRYLMADVPTERLEEARLLLPGIAGPTVMDIYGRPEWKALHAVVDEAGVDEAMRRLKGVGATGILITPVDRMVV